MACSKAKIIAIVIVILTQIVNISNSKVYCGENSEFKCFEDSTCCKTPSGYRCLPVYNGVCCPDGSFACPRGQFCDAKHGNKCVGIS